MAKKAYVLVNTEVGKTADVVKALRGKPGITAVEAVAGPYDVIAVAEGADADAVARIVLTDIHGVAGITRTLTCLTISLDTE